MRFLNANEFVATAPWGAVDLDAPSDASVRLHWTDEPYEWHVNDEPEVFVVLDGVVDMHYRREGVEHVDRLTPGRICCVEAGDEHAAYPAPEARVLVIERRGSI